MKALTVLFFATLLAGCGTMANEARSSQEVYDTTARHSDYHTGSVVVKMQNRTLVASGDRYSRCSFTIRKYDSDTPFQVGVIYRAQDWAFLESAWSAGRELDVILIDREVGRSGWITEQLAISLSEEEMDGYTAYGLLFKLVGKRGSVTAHIPAHYFEGFMRKYRDLQR